MSNADKNILIVPNRGSTTDDPRIDFVGADSSTSGQTISAYVLPINNGTISFEGSAGQLFSITNDLSGTIFSVNDISGIPSLEVDADGTIRLAEFNGNVLVGTATDNGDDRLQIGGSFGLPESSTAAITFTAPTTAQVTVDTVSATSFRAVKYLVQMTRGSLYHMTELNLIHNGSTVFLSQSGDVFTSADLGSFAATITSGTLNLRFTGTGSNTVLKIYRTALRI